MKYLTEMYGKQSPDFVKGFLAALQTYAVWKYGKQWIGGPKRELRDVMKEAVEELAENPENFDREIEFYT